MKNARPFRPQGLEREAQLSVDFKSYQDRRKKQTELGSLGTRSVMSFDPTLPKQPKSLNWSSIKKLDYKLTEEKDISSIIGVDYSKLPFSGKEPAGGGGHVRHRR